MDMNRDKVTILLVGMSGYGGSYLRELLSNQYEGAYLVGVVDINPEKSSYYQEINNSGIPIYISLADFYQEHHADLAIISTPIHLHKEQSCFALNKGSNVLCEKPMTADPDDIQAMIDTRDRTGNFLAIGFNWSFTTSVQQLKKDILSGRFGKPKRLKSIVLWPRTEDYFNRSVWAGKKYSPNGDRIFDSVANNATAHFLHHLFYLTGDSLETSAKLKTVEAELYRTNAIETFDTCAIKITTETGVDVFYYASHAVKDKHKPRFELEFEDATIIYEPEKETENIIANWKDGSRTTYKDPEKNRQEKLSVCLNAIQQGRQDILCGPEAASAHVTCIHAIHESVPDIPTFPVEFVNHDKAEALNWITGLDKVLMDCYENWCMPNDLNCEWSYQGKTINVD